MDLIVRPRPGGSAEKEQNHNLEKASIIRTQIVYNDASTSGAIKKNVNCEFLPRKVAPGIRRRKSQDQEGIKSEET